MTETRTRGSQPQLEQVLDLLADWLPRQRWFGGKDAPVQRVRLLAHTRLRADSGPVDHLVVAVDQPGRSEAYQVLLSLRGTSAPALEPVLVGEAGGNHVYDALHDPGTAAALLHHLARGDTVGSLTFTPEPSASLPLGAEATVLKAEQSNTSLVYGDVALLKVFRRLQVGINPDIEVHRALTRDGSDGVAALMGSIDGAWADATTGERVTGSLAMLQRFMDMAIDGWIRATTSVRSAVADIGSDFTQDARQLGAAAAQIHRRMARLLPHAMWGDAELRRESDEMQGRLDEALARVPVLRRHAPVLRGAFDAVADVAQPVPVQRIHGDLHLGQALHGSSGWVIVDFEGEPAKPLAERVRLQPPARDVAGMLRSFDYAAGHQLAGPSALVSSVVAVAERWAVRNRDAFCQGYADVTGTDPREQAVLLRAFEMDKAVYEAVYEANNRPTWLPIPMAALDRLASS